MTWLKYLLRGTVLVLIAAAGLWYWLLHTGSGASFAWRQVQSALGGDLTGELTAGDFASGIEIRQLWLSTSAVDLRIDSNRAIVRVGLLPLKIEVSELRLQGVTLRLEESESNSEGGPDIESVLASLKLPLQLDLIDAQVNEIEWIASEDTSVLLDQVGASFFWHEQIRIRKFKAVRNDDSLLASGSIDLAGAQPINLAITLIYDSIRVEGDLVGDAHSVEASELSIEGDAIEAKAAAGVDWVDGVRANGSVAVERFDPAFLTEAWPEEKPLTGSLNFDASAEYVRLSDSHLAIDNSDAALQLDADLDRATSRVSAEISWRNLAWPIDTPAPALRSADGKVSVDGDLDDWHVSGVVAVGTEEMPDGRFEIDGGGDQDQVALVIREGRLLGGYLAGDTTYSWRGEKSWSADVEFENLRTTGFVSEWPGDISGKAMVRGSQVPLAIDARLQNIKGVIRGDALTAEGALTWSEDILLAENLSISHGDSVIHLDGSVDTPAGLAFRADVDVGTYVDGVSGDIEAAGRLSRIEGSEFLSLDLSSSVLQIGDIQAAGIRLRDERADDAVAGFSLQIDDLQIQGQNITDIELSTSIRQERQLLDVSGFHRDAKISISLGGAFDDWSLAGRSPWRGSISSFSVDLEDEHRLHLTGTAPVELSSTHLALERFCLADDVNANLCVDGRRDSNGRIDLKAELENVPLALVEHVVDTDASFDQHISGRVNWAGNPNLGATGKGELEISPGAISSRQQPSLAIQTGTGRLSFDITDGDILSGKASIPMPGVGGFEADFKVLELVKAGDSEISGHLGLVMTEIAPLVLITGLVDSASGNLNVELDLNGTISDPVLSGSAAFKNGALSYRPVGLELDHINLRGELTENKAIELAGEFRAGDGHGEIISSADYRDNERPGLRFKIRGEALTLVNVPDILLSVDPDFEIAYAERALNINGALLVSKALITPSNLAESVVTESDDIVIVAGQLSETNAAPEEESEIEFGGSLKVDLGSDVDIILNIARAKMAGSAVFNWQGSAMPIVDGRYDMTGNINAFGQVLDIAEGSIRFANVPADQPYLRIRAEREIFGNSQVKRAGVLVSGVATRPSIDPYTYPVTTEERALTLLVTGSDFDYEQGVGAVDFGTYIAPRLFVSYGVGVFDRENIISARYDLAKGFGVKASSGDKESGVDLNYRFEN